ncbi:MAG: hypothetical protein PHI06_11330, partial [Desulfobulbaceae bacterium]|nr:hypothetical protein [Desulfobulbaceae bacterium]
PDRDAFTFTLPQVEMVKEYINRDDPSLYHDVVEYFKRFSGLDAHQWSVIAHFLFFTYLHDHKDIYYAPILLFYAVPGRGKSRTGKSLTHLAFRGIHLSELREANILRYCENLRSTLFFDIMDVWKKAERTGCEDILLGRFEKGQKCSRVLYPDKGAFKDMKHYDVYGPTIIASNEPLHKILDTRCLHITMPNLPGNYENLHPATALELKARLTAWRGRHLFTELPVMEPIAGISGRLWDISKSLFLVNTLLGADSDLLQEAILVMSTEQSESQQDSFEGRLVAIIKKISEEQGDDGLISWSIDTSGIVKRINEDRPDDKQLSPQWVGKKLKSMSIRHKTVTGRSKIQLNANEYTTLLDQYGFVSRESANPTETLQEKNQHNQYDMGVVGSSRVSGQAQANDDPPF